MQLNTARTWRIRTGSANRIRTVFLYWKGSKPKHALMTVGVLTPCGTRHFPSKQCTTITSTYRQVNQTLLGNKHLAEYGGTDLVQCGLHAVILLPTWCLGFLPTYYMFRRCPGVHSPTLGVKSMLGVMFLLRDTCNCWELSDTCPDPPVQALRHIAAPSTEMYV
jgi:hypothetical protein